MSRIGRMPIAIPAGVEVKIDGNVVTANHNFSFTLQEVEQQLFLAAFRLNS